MYQSFNSIGILTMERDVFIIKREFVNLMIEVGLRSISDFDSDNIY